MLNYSVAELRFTNFISHHQTCGSAYGSSYFWVSIEIISGEANVNVIKKQRERVVFSIENITFAILICIARFLVKESASITMCSFTNTLCAITGDSKKDYNIGIPGIIH